MKNLSHIRRLIFLLTFGLAVGCGVKPVGVLQTSTAAATSALQISAGTASVTHTVSQPDSDTNWTETFDVPKYSGTTPLQSVTLNWTYDGRGRFFGENTDAGSAQTGHFVANFTPDFIGVGALSGISHSESFSRVGDYSLAIYDGTMDFSGPSGVNASYTNSAYYTVTYSYPADAATLALFTGTGNLSFTLEANSNGTTSGINASGMTSSAKESLAVTYVYSQ